jgi:hypothetical protein
MSAKEFRAPEAPPLEALAPPAEVFALPPDHRRAAVVADANALIEDVLRRSSGKFSILPVLAERSLIALVSPEHIEGKVYARLPDVAERIGIDPLRAVETWESVHRPLIRFVDVGDLMLGDPRVGQVALFDEEDVPVAQLGVLLAPSLVLTRDKHLRRAGIGERDWADALLVVQQLAELDGDMWGAVRSLVITGRLTALLVGDFLRLVRRSELAMAGTLSAAVFAALHFGPQLQAGVGRLRAGGPQALARGLLHVSEVFERRAAVDERLKASLVDQSGPQSAEAAVAKVLAERWESTPAATVQDSLGTRGWELSVEQTLDVLRVGSPFHLVRGRGWQLGESRST